jgi:hypothetical protein
LDCNLARFEGYKLIMVEKISCSNDERPNHYF